MCQVARGLVIHESVELGQEPRMQVPGKNTMLKSGYTIVAHNVYFTGITMLYTHVYSSLIYTMSCVFHVYNRYLFYYSIVYRVYSYHLIVILQQYFMCITGICYTTYRLYTQYHISQVRILNTIVRSTGDSYNYIVFTIIKLYSLRNCCTTCQNSGCWNKC